MVQQGFNGDQPPIGTLRGGVVLLEDRRRVARCEISSRRMLHSGPSCKCSQRWQHPPRWPLLLRLEGGKGGTSVCECVQEKSL